MKQLVVELSEEQSARLCAAIGRMNGLHAVVLDKDGSPSVDVASMRPATLDEVHDRVVGYLDGIVRDQEAVAARQVAEAAAVPLGVALKVVIEAPAAEPVVLTGP